ncbi:MAG: butyrate kinase, partial [Deltaproteobacteria bacterium]|nr:butyrate kinase [Deltaproteobacteria bacterium]
MFRILVLNLGGTSSKVAIYEDLKEIADFTLRHTPEDMKKYPTHTDQVGYRKKVIEDWLATYSLTIHDFDAVAARGASIVAANQSGTYLVEGYYRDLLYKLFRSEENFRHGIRIIVPLAEDMMGDKKIPIYITDPPSVREQIPVARICGVKGFERMAQGHVLNQKAVGRFHAEKLGKPFNQCRFAIAHLGGGVSVGAHADGKIIDINDAGDGHGPFSPDRAGTVSSGHMLKMFYTEKLPYEQLFQRIRGNAGLKGHLGTNDVREVLERIKNGDEFAKLIFDAMIYQIAKELGSCVVALRGDVDAILVTGGIAKSEYLVDGLKSYLEKLAPDVAYPGEFEILALASGAYRVLSGQEQPIMLHPV